jgi:pseudouridine kinase
VAQRILVVGGCICDVSVRPSGAVDPATSNPAEIAVATGGVARNVGENLVRLGCEVVLVSAVGRDALADRVGRDLAEIGIDARLVRRGRSAVYVALLGADGTLERGFCDPGGIEALEGAEVEALAGDPARFDGAVLDANLSAETLAAVSGSLRGRGVPYALEPVSDAKSERVRGALAGCALVKPNATEAEALTGLACTSREGAAAAARRLEAAGAGSVVVSTGADGFHLLCPGFDAHVDAEATEVTDATGAGDALLATGFVGLLRGVPGPRLARAMRRAAALACRAGGPASPHVGPGLFEDAEE